MIEHIKKLTLFLLVLLFACNRGETAYKVELEKCRPEGISVEALCGFIEVPEDRNKPEGRRIRLNTVVVPARKHKSEPDPLFLLAGGPGLAATESLAPLAGILSGVQRHRDLVFVDQRGTGGSNPLDCSSSASDADNTEKDGRWSIPEMNPQKIFPTGDLEKCLADLDADPVLYTTPVAMKDLDDVRSALGYERINLWGGSYGTRAALVYMRMYPERVRSVILDGVHLPDNRHPLYASENMQRSLDLMLERCALDDDCSKVFPDLGNRLDELLEDLEEPVIVNVPHPRSGIMQEVVISREGFVMGLGHLLYVPRFVSLMPRTIFLAKNGDFSPFYAQFMAFSSEIRGYKGKQLSVGCAEDIHLINEGEPELFSRDTIFGDSITKAFMEACRIWPRGDIPDDYHDPVISDAPVLIMSGGMDPVTPPKWGDEAAKTLPNSRHLIARGAGHGVIAIPCVPEIIADFLEAGSADDLDFSCAKDYPPPGFFLDFSEDLQ